MAVHQEAILSERNNSQIVRKPLAHAGYQGQGTRVYLDFYDLNESPFSITPDPHFLFLSTTHQVAIDKILYGINSKMGFVLLTGEVGTGKTTVCRSILDHLNGTVETVYIINPSLSGKEIISSILDDLGISYPLHATKKDLIDRLNVFLLAENKVSNVVIMIDDAQTMSLETLEDLRLLSNLETDKEKLIQVILAGQPELLDLLSRDRLRQLKQRVAIHCRMDLLKKEEVEGYITRRLLIAGDRGVVRFTREAAFKVYKHSKGVPRLINKICDYALTAGYVSNAFIIRPEHIRRALREFDDADLFPGNPVNGKRMRRRILIPVIVSALLLQVGLFFLGSNRFDTLDWIARRDIQSHFSAIVPAEFNFAKEGRSRIIPDKEIRKTAVKTIHTENQPNAFPALEPAKGMEKVSDMIKPENYQYALQLGSYKSRANIFKAYQEIKKKGIDVTWQKHDQGSHGVWYRLLTKRFVSKQAAEKFKHDHGLDNAIIAVAPWTIFIGEYPLKKDLQKIQRKMQDLDFGVFYTQTEDGRFYVFTGYYPNYEKAGQTLRALARFGINATIVRGFL